ncbi:tetratricopeptide repeat-containing sensor histidine kinase [Flavivirga jejuensis]|uniref:histidine kinase n=1 Tax=Flavivirga jejuensis TaxID=870487 RepID=A0ABT8WPA3_9FLAO|nr:tetratricopeptide repeat protein [Flavivirga jejuensis]MDO5975003.1 tetratricopeptide repeat protein [Flavivirga jejuensis]
MKEKLSLLKRFVALFFLSFYVSLTAQTDSLEQKLVTAPKEEKVEIYKQLVEKHINIKVDKAIDYAKLGLELVKAENSMNTGLFYMKLGYLHNNKSEHIKALFYYEKALEVAEVLKNELRIAKCYQNIGVTHVKMGHYDLALDYDLKALKIYEKFDEEVLITTLTGNIGSLYSCRLGDNENGLLYYSRALELSKKTGNDVFRSHVLGAVAEMYMRQKEFTKAVNSLEKSIDLAEKANYPRIVLSGLKNLSQIKIEEKKFKEALAHSKRALQMCLELGYTEDIASIYLALADIYEKMGNTKAAASHYNQALAEALKTKALPQLSKVYGALHEYANRKRDYKKSYEYVLKYNMAKDSLFTKEKDKQLKEIQSKFDLESKEKEILLLTNENKIKTLENKNQRTTQTQLIIGLVALTIILLALFNDYKTKRKNNKVLAEKNNVISQTLKEREILLKEVHHRVKNNLQIVSSLLRLQHKFGNHKSAEDILQEVQDKIQAMSIIHERLYKSSDLSLINLETYLDNLLTYFNTSYDLPEQSITIMTAIDFIDLNMDYLVPCGLIINEIIANSIKHAFQDDTKGYISIEAIKNKDKCVLTIEDTGIGFPEGFKVENSQSLGIQLIQGLTKQIKGTLDITSNPGACYTITFNMVG